MLQQVDLDKVFKKGSLELALPEQDDERAARLRREERHSQRQSQRQSQREHVLFYVILASVLAVSGICLWAIFASPSLDPDTRAFSRTVLTSLLSGGIAFLFGRSMSRS